jgi:hypothetical protein
VNDIIDVHNEDVLYNWMDRASMFISKASMPFKATKEMHLVMVHTWIDVCSKTRSFIMNLFTSIGMCLSSRNSFSISLHQILCLTIFHITCSNVKAYQSLGYHILALESNMEVFSEVLELFIEVVMFDPKFKHIHNFDIDSLIKKCSRRLFNYE